VDQHVLGAQAAAGKSLGSMSANAVNSLGFEFGGTNASGARDLGLDCRESRRGTPAQKGVLSTGLSTAAGPQENGSLEMFAPGDRAHPVRGYRRANSMQTPTI
jgi:hypothetical protein